MFSFPWQRIQQSTDKLDNSNLNNVLGVSQCLMKLLGLYCLVQAETKTVQNTRNSIRLFIFFLNIIYDITQSESIQYTGVFMTKVTEL